MVFCGDLWLLDHERHSDLGWTERAERHFQLVAKNLSVDRSARLAPR
jgi:hypothetical protein